MVDNPETIATAIRIGHPQSWDLAWNVQKESNGWFDKFSDEKILAAQKMLSQFEGIFCEPASATSLAGALHDISTGKIPNGSTIVCTLTGNGIKDPEIAMMQCAEAKPVTIDASLDAVKKAILDNL
jgi:threonine synthase